MSYFINGYFAKRDFDTDLKTGLKTQIRATKLVSDAELAEIEIHWKKVLVSPTGAVMEVLETGFFMRDDVIAGLKKYSDLKASAVGQGIQQMVEALDFSRIANDLSNFPQCLTQGYTAP